jgi:predicted nuclease of restriction endonuclease-like (RecB) superfamily
LDDDYSFNVHLKRNLIHKSTYLQGCIKKATVKRWLEHLIQTPLYRRYNTEIDPTFLNVDNVSEDTYESDEINQHPSDIECLLAQNTRCYGTKTNICLCLFSW